MLKVFLIGIGNIGQEIARTLSKQNNINIISVMRSPNNIKDIPSGTALKIADEIKAELSPLDKNIYKFSTCC